MKAGDFFINLGLTGAEKMAGGLAQINDHFSGLKGMAVESKIAILAALAGLEQIVSISGKFGNELTKTTQFLNENSTAIQTWENAAQRFGAGAGEMTSALQGIQNMMNDIWAGKGPPEFLPTIMSMLSRAGEKFKPEELSGQANYWAQHPLDFFRHMNNAANLKGIDKGRLGYMLAQLGIPQDILNVGRMGAFSDKNLALSKSLGIGSGDVNQLNKLNVEWKTFELTMEKMVHLFGTELVPTVEKLNRIASLAVNLLEKWRVADQGITDKRINDMIFGPGISDKLSSFRINPNLSAGANMARLNQVFHTEVTIHGVNPKDHAGIKKAVKDGIREGNKSERTRNIATATPTVSY